MAGRTQLIRHGVNGADGMRIMVKCSVSVTCEGAKMNTRDAETILKGYLDEKGFEYTKIEVREVSYLEETNRGLLAVVYGGSPEKIRAIEPEAFSFGVRNGIFVVFEGHKAVED